MKTVVLAPGETRQIPDHPAMIKIASEEADERFCVLEAGLEAGLGPRLHRHRKHAESWFVLEGALEISSGDVQIPAPAGSFALAPPGAPHTFRNHGPGEARIFAFYAPGGLDRFLTELGRISVEDPPRFMATADLFTQYETEPVDEDAPAGPPVLVLGPGEGEHLSVGGVSMTILADAEATGGLFAAVDYTAPPGFPGPPPHRHREVVDIFYVLEGELAMQVDGEAVAAPAGTLVMVAPGTVHTFANRSDEPARFLGIVSPGGFEQYFRELAAAVGDGPIDPAVVGPLIAKYDFEAA